MTKTPPEQERLPLGPATPSEVFARIRNYLAGRHLGATRDSALLDQVLLCLFAKIHLSELRNVHDLEGQSPGGVRSRYLVALRELRTTLPADCLPDASLTLDSASVEYVDRLLSLLDLRSAATDPVGDAYQCFRGSDIRGQDGQFFTPSSAIRVLLTFIDPKPGELIIDPAAGAGGFLFAAAHHLGRQGVSCSEIARCLYGVEKDAYLARLARIRVSLMTLRRTKVDVGDSLAWAVSGQSSFMHKRKPGTFDVVLTNPPFGARIVAASEPVRRQFSLAYKWVAQHPTSKLLQTRELMRNTPPQVLFIERCLSLVKPGGRVGMVIPESTVSGSNYRHVVEFLLRSAIIEAVVGMPESLFKTSGKGGTHTKTVLLCVRKVTERLPQDHSVFMAEATWCGNDSRGRQIPRDDTPSIINNWLLSRREPRKLTANRLGFLLPSTRLKPGTLAPRAYDPELPGLLDALGTTHLLLRFGDLARDGVLSTNTGDEVGKLAYGTGDIPFVRTSDLSNWEIKVDPKHSVGRSLFEALKAKQDVQPGDLLMVRDGTYLVGTCAIVTKYDTDIILQSHIYKIRVRPNDLLDPYLLLAILSSPVVQRQIRSHVQTQDIINSLGNRLYDLILPVPRDERKRFEISQMVQRVIRERIEARELVREVIETVASLS